MACKKKNQILTGCLKMNKNVIEEKHCFKYLGSWVKSNGSHTKIFSTELIQKFTDMKNLKKLKNDY